MPETSPAPSLVDTYAERMARLVELARVGNRIAFSKLVLRDAGARRLDIEPLHRALLDFVDDSWQHNKYAGVLAPWRHSKTTLLIEGIASHEIGLNQNTRIRLISGDDREAMSRVSTVRRVITSDEYLLVFPNVGPSRKHDSEWSKHTLYVERESKSRDATLSAASVLSSEAGGGYDVIMFDDIVTWQNSELRPADRPKIYDAMTNVWLQRVDADVRVVLVGTRWVHDDAYGKLMDIGDPWRWLKVSVNAALDGFNCDVLSGKRTFYSFTLPLWSKRPTAWLKQRLATNHRAFERGYRQNAPAEEDRLFGDLTPLIERGVLVSDLLRDVRATYFGGFDPAGERRVGNALVTSALAPTGRRIIANIRLWRGSFRETTNHVVMIYQTYKHHLLAVENVALQGAIIELIYKTDPGVPVLPFLTGKNKADPTLGVPGLEAEIRAGTWALCLDDPYDTGTPLAEHEPTCGCAYHTFLQDLINYPAPGRTYDALMAWWFCREAIRGTVAADEQQRGRDAGDGGVVRAESGGVPDEDFGGNYFG